MKRWSKRRLPVWLDPSDEMKYISDREIKKKHVDLDKSCLTDTEKKQVMDMLYE